ncbi:UbiH/UbiF/VisC/COQ6 family ubiquinone biosynthesis hydroxylase [Rickettsiella grylli]|nr:UbiH/UbiF/VisC/COQ6 family ubiquinone biosynthesis hydroxylase [Rickettsiella grylli]
MTLKTIPTDFDIVIVGGGIMGLTLACHLIEKDLKIAIINKETIAQSSNPLTSKLRTIALTLASCSYLKALKVWQRFNEKQYAPFRCMEVWEASQSSQLFVDSADIGEPSLGYIVKNDDLKHALYAQAKTDPELTWITKDALFEMHVEENHIDINLISGLKLRTRLLVGADGDQSKVRQLAGFYSKATDYQQRALIATVKNEWAHENMARQIFLEKGSLAFLPLKNPFMCSIVWSSDPVNVRHLETIDDDLFCSELTQAIEQRLGQVISTSPRLSYPLKIQEVERYVKPRIALIGDCAHIIHPLAGQGANLGLADVQCLARVVVEAKQKGRSISALHTLRRYERERRFHNRLMMGSVDAIKYLFLSTHPVLQKTRQYGLTMINRTTCLKNVIARYAMGSF